MNKLETKNALMSVLLSIFVKFLDFLITFRFLNIVKIEVKGLDFLSRD